MGPLISWFQFGLSSYFILWSVVFNLWLETLVFPTFRQQINLENWLMNSIFVPKSALLLVTYLGKWLKHLFKKTIKHLLRFHAPGEALSSPGFGMFSFIFVSPGLASRCGAYWTWERGWGGGRAHELRPDRGPASAFLCDSPGCLWTRWSSTSVAGLDVFLFK